MHAPATISPAPTPLEGLIRLRILPEHPDWTAADYTLSDGGDGSFDPALIPLIHALAASAVRRENMCAK